MRRQEKQLGAFRELEALSVMRLEVGLDHVVESLSVFFMSIDFLQ